MRSSKVEDLYSSKSKSFMVPVIDNPVAPPLNWSEQWYDVLDEEGVWRVGFCQKNFNEYKRIALDGFHPSHTAFYCQHSQKLAGVRTHTKGLTVPQKKTIRRVINMTELKQMKGNIALVLQLQADLFLNSAQRIRILLRTQLLIFIDKIFNTPFQVYRSMNLENPMDKVDIAITNLFLNVIECFFILLQNSKKILTLREVEKGGDTYKQKAQQLYRCVYEMTIIVTMILGFHRRSKAFYNSSLNTTITKDGNVLYFIKSETGMLSLKLFFKNSSLLKSVRVEDFQIFAEVAQLFLDICENYQKETLQGKVQSTVRLTVQEIISMLKNFCNKSILVAKQVKKRVEMISRIEALYFKLFPNKVCTIRQFLQGEAQAIKEVKKSTPPVVSELMVKKSAAHQRESEKMKQLEGKVAQLETALGKLETFNLHSRQFLVQKEEKKEQREPSVGQPTQNLGEEAFLGSLEWALEAGDIKTSCKLVRWRRGLLKLGRITGWEIALAVGQRTFRKKQIEPQDIIEANYAYISQMKNPSRAQQEQAQESKQKKNEVRQASAPQHQMAVS